MSPSTTSLRNCRRAVLSIQHPLRNCQKRHVSTQLKELADCDIVIVGGGPVGLALASALGSSPTIRDKLSVTLIEAGDLSQVRHWAPASSTYSNRVSSLTNASQNFLKRLDNPCILLINPYSLFSGIGVWDRVEDQRTCAVEDMKVWDGVSDARIEFSASELGLKDFPRGMARITENLNLQRGLLEQLETLPAIRLLQRTKVQTIVRDSEESGGWPLVYLDNGEVLRSRLLIGADGFNSPVRSYAGIPSFGWSYDTQAIVATMEHPPRGAFELPNTIAYQRFLPTGPIAFLPLSPTVSSLVWSTRPSIAKTILASDPAVLTSMINAAFRLPDLSLKYLYDRILEAHNSGTPIRASQIQDEILWRENSYCIGQNSVYSSTIKASPQTGIPPENSNAIPPLVSSLQSGSVASFPLRFNHAETYIGEGRGSRTVLVGDAAHTVHPLAGQGLNMGLRDAECLARCIENALQHGGDVGSYTALLPYAQERYLANHILMAAIDKLHKLYSTDFEPVVWARTVGLEVLNELDSVKAAIMLTAGAESQTTTSDVSTGWSLAAQTVANVVATVNTSIIIGTEVKNALATGISNLTRYQGQNQ